MGQIDISCYPWMGKMQDAPAETGERLEIALSYIDFVVATLLRCQKNMTAKRIKKLLEDGQKNWAVLVDKELVVMVDSNGDENLLDYSNYPEFFISRVLGSASNDQQYDVLLGISKTFCKFLGWGDLTVIEESE